MIYLKKLTKTAFLTSIVISLSACNGGGGSSSGSSWNAAGIGGGNVDNIINVVIQNNYAYGVSWKRGSNQMCLSKTPYGTNNWSNVRCDSGNTMGYTVDENGNVFLVKSVAAYNPDNWNGEGQVQTDVYITDENGNQIGQTLHTCQNPTHYDPANVACVYPPYYTGSSFTASNGKIYFGGGTGIHFVSMNANMNTAWENNVIDPDMGGFTGDKPQQTWGAAYSWAVGTSGTMYISGQWLGEYRTGNWTDYIGQSNGMGQASWNAYVNSYLPYKEYSGGGGAISLCSNNQIWEDQQYVMVYSNCQIAGSDVRTNKIRGLVKNSFSGNWVVFNEDVPQPNDQIMYVGFQNTFLAVKLVQQGATGLAQLVPVVDNII
jgi:hypothetical protein